MRINQKLMKALKFIGAAAAFAVIVPFVGAKASADTMGLRWLLKRFGVFSNDYYNYLKDRKVAYRKRKENLLNCITETYHERKSTPGYRLMADQNQSDNVSKIHEL